jgi:hypothetical protein
MKGMARSMDMMNLVFMQKNQKRDQERFEKFCKDAFKEIKHLVNNRDIPPKAG